MRSFYETAEGHSILTIEHKGEIYEYGVRPSGFIASYLTPGDGGQALEASPLAKRVEGGPGTYGHTDYYLA